MSSLLITCPLGCDIKCSFVRSFRRSLVRACVRSVVRSFVRSSDWSVARVWVLAFVRFVRLFVGSFARSSLSVRLFARTLNIGYLLMTKTQFPVATSTNSGALLTGHKNGPRAAYCVLLSVHYRFDLS